jgi:ATP-dependent Clp protease protease subunit
MGSLIAVSGTKKKRFTLANARNLMHQPLLSGVMEGQATDLEIEAREMLRIRDRIYQVYADATGQPIDRVARDCDRNKWLDENEMLEYGLVDQVLHRMPVTKQVRERDDE